MNDVLRFLAAWALLHESADDAWKAAVARGERLAAGHPVDDDAPGQDAFADALAALVSAEKERLKASLTSAAVDESDGSGHDDLGRLLRELRFELAEVRARVESLQASVDALREQRGS
jgi:hypothetical protein